MNERNDSQKKKAGSSRACACGDGCDCGISVNPSIECSVEHCAYHCKSEPYCSLDRVRISSAESSPDCCSKVDCRSFSPEKSAGSR